MTPLDYLSGTSFVGYPDEIWLLMLYNKTNVSQYKCSFLDFSISIYRGYYFVNYTDTIMDKRNYYDFEIIINYPYLDANIPKNQLYGLFINNCKGLVDKLFWQHFDPVSCCISQTIRSVCRRLFWYLGELRDIFSCKLSFWVRLRLYTDLDPFFN